MGGDGSLKRLFQGLVPVECELLEGTVLSLEPLKLQISSDEKLIVGPASVIVPKHMTDYEANVTIKLGSGSLSAATEGDGKHAHSACVYGTGHSGDGTHNHHLVSFELDGGTITIRNGLKAGEKVHVLALNSGKLYYILDRA